MKDVAPHDRPREKLERLGTRGLGDNELLALVIGSGSREADALSVANQLIEHAGGLHGLTRMGLDYLRVVSGVGPARAARIVAAVEPVTEDAVAEVVPCGKDPERHLEQIEKFADAGFDHVWVHQIGEDQTAFFRFYRDEVLPKL